MFAASLGILLAPVSSSLIGPIVDAAGRKLGLLILHFFMGLGFAVIACATEVWHIYVGRCICSFGLGENFSALTFRKFDLKWAVRWDLENDKNLWFKNLLPDRLFLERRHGHTDF